MAMLRTMRLLVKRGDARALREVTHLLNCARKGELSPAPEIVSRIAAFLQRDDWPVQNEAVKLVGKLQLTEFLPVLAAMLASSPIGFLRRNAADALAQFPVLPAECFPPLWKGLNDPYWEVRTSCVGALAIFGDEARGLEERLCAMLEYREGWLGLSKWSEPNFEVRIAACDALSQCGRSKLSLERLAECCRDGMWKVRAAAVEALVEVAIRGHHDQTLVNVVLERFDPICIHFTPRFPLSTAQNRAATKWRHHLHPPAAKEIPA